MPMREALRIASMLSNDSLATMILSAEYMEDLLLGCGY